MEIGLKTKQVDYVSLSIGSCVNFSDAQRMLERGKAGRDPWQSEVDGLLQVLLTSRNQSVLRTQHQITDLRSALRKIEHRLDVYGGQSTGAADHADSPTSDDKAEPIREPLQQNQVIVVVIIIIIIIIIIAQSITVA